MRRSSPSDSVMPNGLPSKMRRKRFSLWRNADVGATDVVDIGQRADPACAIVVVRFGNWNGLRQEPAIPVILSAQPELRHERRLAAPAACRHAHANGCQIVRMHHGAKPSSRRERCGGASVVVPAPVDEFAGAIAKQHEHDLWHRIGQAAQHHLAAVQRISAWRRSACFVPQGFGSAGQGDGALGQQRCRAPACGARSGRTPGRTARRRRADRSTETTSTCPVRCTTALIRAACSLPFVTVHVADGRLARTHRAARGRASSAACRCLARGGRARLPHPPCWHLRQAAARTTFIRRCWSGLSAVSTRICAISAGTRCLAAR